LNPFIAAGTITTVSKKIFVDAPCDDPRAALSRVMLDVQPVGAVLDDERFVAAVSYGLSQTAATAAGFSIATTAVPSAGILHCNNAPSDVPAEISSTSFQQRRAASR
jgi:hypothetical protein